MSHNSDPLDEEFPLGDGSAATDAVVYCPYCNESVEIALDPGSGSSQQYVEDCEVCCQPWTVSVQYRQDGGADVTVTALDG
ncbi:MAG TPA: CPXCG motif-containing cysteine-rich protein [Gemmatimonadaceae bacterium]|nr:CPXCG motif-containing cysteine-rich protein [Gemmatimonadaceae bacterium]